MDHEERTLRRKKLITYPGVFDRNTNQLLGRVLDITTEGVRIINKEPIKADQSFNLRMTLPSSILGNDEITFDACSVWSDRDINPDYYSTGFNVTEIADRDVRRIESLVREFSFRN
ncbi:MAG: hypothetical protein DRP47_10645 [Candidatus Zixiibacteriota bacterium]|nr:MAG: hypothetical protein DRP47_10645 [candidate division Zixibacteria bacterium]